MQVNTQQKHVNHKLPILKNFDIITKQTDNSEFIEYLFQEKDGMGSCDFIIKKNVLQISNIMLTFQIAKLLNNLPEFEYLFSVNKKIFIQLFPVVCYDQNINQRIKLPEVYCIQLIGNQREQYYGQVEINQEKKKDNDTQNWNMFDFSNQRYMAFHDIQHIGNNDYIIHDLQQLEHIELYHCKANFLSGTFKKLVSLKVNNYQVMGTNNTDSRFPNLKKLNIINLIYCRDISTFFNIPNSVTELRINMKHVNQYINVLPPNLVCLKTSDLRIPNIGNNTKVVFQGIITIHNVDKFMTNYQYCQKIQIEHIKLLNITKRMKQTNQDNAQKSNYELGQKLVQYENMILALGTYKNEKYYTKYTQEAYKSFFKGIGSNNWLKSDNIYLINPNSWGAIGQKFNEQRQNLINQKQSAIRNYDINNFNKKFRKEIIDEIREYCFPFYIIANCQIKKNINFV